ncbi:hypothetical protein Tco_0735528, partial [Tanacetum coccineum]
AKTVNGEVQLQALVYGKKIIIIESTVRRDLQLEDAEGVDCLPNATIFEQLTLMSSKTTAWNEFSSTMTSTIICLATNQKFNFSKSIFESMVKNLDNMSEFFLIYLRYLGIITESTVRRDLQLEDAEGVDCLPNATIFELLTLMSDNVAEEAVNEEMDDSLVRVATTVTSLNAEQDSGNIDKTQSKATLNEPSSSGTSSGNTLRSGEDRLKLEELMALCTTLQSRVLSLDTTKTTQATEIASLKKKAKKLEMRNKSRTHGLKRLYRVGSSRRAESYEDEGLGEEDASKQGRIADIDANEDIYLVNVQIDEDMFGLNDLEGDEVLVESEVSAASEIPTVTTADELTLAQALAELKSARPPTQGISFREPSEATTTTTTTTITAAPKPPQDKGKGIMIEELMVEKENLMKKQERMRIDEEFAFKLQAKEEEEEESLAREKAQQIEETNIAWDDIQAKIDADYQLAQRLQAQEQEELTDEEKARLFHKDLKSKDFDSIKELFDKAFKRVNMFVDYRTDLVEGSSKRAGYELEQEVTKKQKVDDVQETAEVDDDQEADQDR